MYIPPDSQLGTEVEILGRRFLFVKDDRSGSVLVYCMGSAGFNLAFNADISYSGSLKIKPRGSWRFTVPQYREVYSRIFDMLEESQHALV